MPDPKIVERNVLAYRKARKLRRVKVKYRRVKPIEGIDPVTIEIARQVCEQLNPINIPGPIQPNLSL